MRIYVVGFMGAGKTTIGELLGRRMETPFFDLDQLVEESEGMSIKEIFATRGEPYFRKRERDILLSTRHLEKCVVATGGGTFTFEDNIEFIRSEGLSIYLSAPFLLLRGRIGEKAAERPMFRDDMATHALYQSRLKFYRMCDVCIEIREEETPAEIVERLYLELPRDLRATDRSRATGWEIG